MDVKQLTEKVVEHEARLAAHEEELKTLFNQQKAIEELTKTNGELISKVGEMSGTLASVDKRLDEIENDGKRKRFAVWQIAASALLGGGITYLVTLVLGG